MIARSPTLPHAFEIAGALVHPIHLTTLLEWIETTITTHNQGVVMYANIHAANLARRNKAFRAAIQSADIVFCDGQGLRLGAALLNNHLPERFTPPDWIMKLIRRCHTQGWKIALIGGKPGVTEQVASHLREQVGPLEIICHHGYFALGSCEEQQLLTLLRAFQPQVVLVGMGMPRQELWVQQTIMHLPPSVVITVGALFDYLARITPRGPRWLTDNGFEWLCRLWFEPQRLWRRYLLGNPAFFIAVLRQYLQQQRHT